MDDSSLSNLTDLARHLAFNYAQVSFEKDFNKFDQILEKECFNGKTYNGKATAESRNILVIGAGASAHAYNFIPPGRKAIEEIEKEVGFDELKEIDNIKKSYLKEAFKITHKTYTEINQIKDFETRLFLLSNYYHASTIRQAIEKIFKYRTFPSLLYEIVAHMFKNKFIDIVMNFNFDELLDQAIDEEIGGGKIYKILSDGDCVTYDKMLIDHRLKVPVYIKPHGTYSHRSTLRFTKDHYVDIPSGIETYIDDLFQWKTKKGHSVDQKKINLIVVGFEMESVEFNKIITSALRKHNGSKSQENLDINVYFFYYHHDFPSPLERKEREEKKKSELLDRINHSINISSDEKEQLLKEEHLNFIHVGEKEPNLDTAFSELYEQIEYQFKSKNNTQNQNKAPFRETEINKKYDTPGKYSPRGLSRHQLVCNCFNDKIDKIRSKKSVSGKRLFFNSSGYYLQRTILELIIACFKNKGKIQLRELLDDRDRVAIYYNYYTESLKEESEDKDKKESNGDTIPPVIFSLDTICTKMGMLNDELSMTRNLYSFGEVSNQNHYQEFKTGVFGEIRNAITPKSDSKLKEAIQKMIDKLDSAKETCLEDIFNSDVIDVYPNYSEGQLLIFDSYSPENTLPTSLALEYKFYEPFFDKDFNKRWKILLTVAERGKYLINEKKSLEKWASEGKRIELIASENFYEEQLLSPEVKEVLFQGEYFDLPYYTHNQHMAIFLDVNEEDKPVPVRGIYYYKKGYSNKVNPVCFDITENSDENKNNLDFLLELYFAYRLKAEGYKSKRSIMFIENAKAIDVDAQLKKLKKRYLEDIVK